MEWGVYDDSMQASTPLPVNSVIDMNPSASAGINPYAAHMPMMEDMYTMRDCLQFSPDNAMIMPPVNETIFLPSCVLYPPHPGHRIKPNKRHPGCKTVFVGGLPEKISEDVICEIFSRCGEISALRMTKKRFCHVRFTSEAHVDNAIMLSGYEIKMGSIDEHASFGRLHVDYAKPRADEQAWECLQHALQRKNCDRERMKKEALRTPKPIFHYSEHNASLLTYKLKSERHLKSAARFLIRGLERGECNRRTCGTFFSMIQRTNSHVTRLLDEKFKLEKKLSEAKRLMQEKIIPISLCFNEIYKIFETVQGLPTVMNSFTKAQRKQIEMMREVTLYIIKTHSKELVEERVEDEMELSEDEDQKLSENSFENRKGVSKEKVCKLREELEELSKRYQNVIEINATLKREIVSNCNTHAKILQEKREKVIVKKAELSEQEKFNQEFLATRGLTIAATDQSHENRSSSVWESGNHLTAITQHEMCLIALIATFLSVPPFGASIDYICLYLMNYYPNTNAKDIESLLDRFPNIFEKHITGTGATLKKEWKYLGIRMSKFNEL